MILQFNSIPMSIAREHVAWQVSQGLTGAQIAATIGLDATYGLDHLIKCYAHYWVENFSADAAQRDAA